jgi:LacI family transcriptional regulator
MGALDELGLALPGDVALVSFDDPACFPLMRCPVSAIRQPTDRIGRATFAALLARIEGRAGPEPVDLLLPARFVPRESCGAAGAGIRRKTATAVERR